WSLSLSLVHCYLPLSLSFLKLLAVSSLPPLPVAQSFNLSGVFLSLSLSLSPLSVSSQPKQNRGLSQWHQTCPPDGTRIATPRAAARSPGSLLLAGKSRITLPSADASHKSSRESRVSGEIHEARVSSCKRGRIMN